MKQNDDPCYKHALLSELSNFAEQRPGIDPYNYSTWRAYRNEAARVTRQLHNARAALNAAWCDPKVTFEHIIEASKRAYMGRLHIDPETAAIDYTTGQYFPTEYRAAVVSVLTEAIELAEQKPPCTS